MSPVASAQRELAALEAIDRRADEMIAGHAAVEAAVSKLEATQRRQLDRLAPATITPTKDPR